VYINIHDLGTGSNIVFDHPILHTNLTRNAKSVQIHLNQYHAMTEVRSTLGVDGFALITGGGSGIGRATSLLLARENCHGIALADVNEAGLAKVKTEIESVATCPSFRCITIKVDVSNEESVRDMIAKTVEAFGRIDFAANIAGIGAVKGPIAEGKLQDWNKMIAVNLTGVWICAKEEILQMMKQEPRENSRCVSWRIWSGRYLWKY